MRPFGPLFHGENITLDTEPDDMPQSQTAPSEVLQVGGAEKREGPEGPSEALQREQASSPRGKGGLARS